MTRWQSILQAHLRQSTKPLIVILGPTASGKTAFSLEIAKWMEKHPLPFKGRGQGEGWIKKVEIINADSRQLYKYLDCGTAKITKEEMGDIPHHLFSVLDPKEKVTVGWYKREAERVMDEILARGNVPILVGGSMLYISAVTDGYVFTGRGGKRRASVPYDLLFFGLRWPREELVKRIEERTRKLLVRDDTASSTTWLSEVAWLLAHGYTGADPGLESCGYRAIAAWILSGKREASFPLLQESICTATRQYAKRQMTWWKKDARIHWILCSAQPTLQRPSSARRATTSQHLPVCISAPWKTSSCISPVPTRISPPSKRSQRPQREKK